MSESSQNDPPVIFWISMQPNAADAAEPVDASPGRGPCRRDTPTASAGPAARSRSGLFIPYSALKVIAVLVGGGASGLLIAVQWPQAAAALGTVCAVIGAGLAILEIARRRDGNPRSPRDRD